MRGALLLVWGPVFLTDAVVVRACSLFFGGEWFCARSVWRGKKVPDIGSGCGDEALATS